MLGGSRQRMSATTTWARSSTKDVCPFSQVLDLPIESKEDPTMSDLSLTGDKLLRATVTRSAALASHRRAQRVPRAALTR